MDQTTLYFTNVYFSLPAVNFTIFFRLHGHHRPKTRVLCYPTYFAFSQISTNESQRVIRILSGGRVVDEEIHLNEFPNVSRTICKVVTPVTGGITTPELQDLITTLLPEYTYNTLRQEYVLKRERTVY